MQIRELMIPEPGRIELVEGDLDDGLAAHEVLIQTEFSVVSAGTEGAGFTGLVKQMPFGDGGQYPRNTGYGNLGHVLAVGSADVGCAVDDRVLSFSSHASHVKADSRRMVLPMPKGTGQHLAFTRMAGVSIAALRSSSVQPGDTVLVIGAGLVGNFAAQLFRLAGADVAIADLSNLRLERARQCGIERTCNVDSQQLEDFVKEWTEDRGVRVSIEAIGISEIVAQAVNCTGRHGEVILLGSPRAPAVFDATPMLLRIHLEAIRMIGSLEWRWPQHETERSRDLDANYRQLARWIADGRLAVEPLLTHRAAPADCQQIYDGLTGRREEFLGAVFDWST
ncbi:MAG TPA: zinc-binding alcohol dehydrogenase [Candidatus Handelsmanbacteria bacterium]|nr:zinc-binding alcohol dehydrogenase [Candidatus Handelsmanbacteria bacterium]